MTDAGASGARSSVHGWLIIDKPAAMTSARVVSVVRRTTGAVKAGHGGTLDPLATGVLPIALGEAKFYAPSLDIMIRDALGREWQLSTIQIDFNAPERFDLEYIGPDNQPHRPLVIHRAYLGSFERFIAVLIEHYAGAFPAWLAPVQAVIIPISEEKHGAYGRELLGRLETERELPGHLLAEVAVRLEPRGHVGQERAAEVPFQIRVDAEVAPRLVLGHLEAREDLGTGGRRVAEPVQMPALNDRRGLPGLDLVVLPAVGRPQRDVER